MYTMQVAIVVAAILVGTCSSSQPLLAALTACSATLYTGVCRLVAEYAGLEAVALQRVQRVLLDTRRDFSCDAILDGTEDWRRRRLLLGRALSLSFFPVEMFQTRASLCTGLVRSHRVRIVDAFVQRLLQLPFEAGHPRASFRRLCGLWWSQVRAFGLDDEGLQPLPLKLLTASKSSQVALIMHEHCMATCQGRWEAIEKNSRLQRYARMALFYGDLARQPVDELRAHLQLLSAKKSLGLRFQRHLPSMSEMVGLLLNPVSPLGDVAKALTIVSPVVGGVAELVLAKQHPAAAKLLLQHGHPNEARMVLEASGRNALASAQLDLLRDGVAEDWPLVLGVLVNDDFVEVVGRGEMWSKTLAYYQHLHIHCLSAFQDALQSGQPTGHQVAALSQSNSLVRNVAMCNLGYQLSNCTVGDDKMLLNEAIGTVEHLLDFGELDVYTYLAADTLQSLRGLQEGQDGTMHTSSSCSSFLDDDEDDDGDYLYS